jgi:hypothetical protein
MSIQLTWCLSVVNHWLFGIWQLYRLVCPWLTQLSNMYGWLWCMQSGTRKKVTFFDSHRRFLPLSHEFRGERQFTKILYHERYDILCCNMKMCVLCKRWTRTGEGAGKGPSTKPPNTRPSGPASETVRPPIRLLSPEFSEGTYEPVKERISKRPCKLDAKHYLKYLLGPGPSSYDGPWSQMWL